MCIDANLYLKKDGFEMLTNKHYLIDSKLAVILETH